MAQQGDQSSSSVYDFTPTPIGEKGYRWAQIINAVLTSDYLDKLAGVIRDRSTLPELITLQLYEHLARVYRHKVEIAFEKQGVEALDLSQSHFRLISDPVGEKNTPQSVEVCLDETAAKSHLREALLLFLERQDFRDEFARAIGSNLVVWALEEIDTEHGSGYSEALSTHELKQTIGSYIND
ncbi:MAG: transcriptional regulator, partial [Cyanobacteria bacterium J06626_14]